MPAWGQQSGAEVRKKYFTLLFWRSILDAALGHRPRSRLALDRLRTRASWNKQPRLHALYSLQ